MGKETVRRNGNEINKQGKTQTINKQGKKHK